MRKDSVAYTLLFAAAICVVCAVVVSSSAVGLRDLQARNAELDRRRNVLRAAGLLGADQKLSPEGIEQRFAQIDALVVELQSGTVDDSVDATTFNQRKAATDPATSRKAPPNPALVQRIPNHAVVYRLRDAAGELELVILPVEGKGLWSTMYGYLALESDLDTVRGLTFYEQGETAGLGGEVANPGWQGLWVGRKAFDEAGSPSLEVIRGRAGPPAEDPHRVDGISGATITGRGVTNLLDFWLGENGFGPYLGNLREGAA